MSGIRDQEDCALRAEVALLGSDPTHDGLDVVDPCLGLDHRIEAMCCGDPVGAAPITWDRDGDLGTPADRFVQSSSESPKQRDVGLVANRQPEGMDADAQFVPQRGGDARKKVKVDVRGGPGFDAS
jgi:hypothetical protein